MSVVMMSKVGDGFLEHWSTLILRYRSINNRPYSWWYGKAGEYLGARTPRAWDAGRRCIGPGSEVRVLRATKLAEVVLARFGVRGARLKPLRLGFAHVFRVTSRSDGAFALRMYAVPEVDEEALRADPGLRRAWGCVRRARCGRCSPGWPP